MFPILLKILLPFAVDMVKDYVKNSDTKHDDIVLDIVNEGAEYISQKDNNLLVPFATSVIKDYVKSSDSNKDDIVFDVIKNGVEYMAEKDNNTVSLQVNHLFQNSKMKSNKQCH